MFRDIQEIESICFLCGECLQDGRPTNAEHIFPKWVLRKYEINGNVARYIGNLGAFRDFWRTTSKVHKECNSRFGLLSEGKISTNNFNNNELWLWAMKIVCGLFFHEFKSFYKVPEFQPNASNDRYADLFIHFWEGQNEIFENGEPYYSVPFTVIELDHLFKNEKFYHFVHFELGVFWLVFNGKCYVIFFRDQLSDEELSQAKKHWDTLLKKNTTLESDSDIQFLYNIYVSSIAIDIYFKRRAQFWVHGMTRMEFDRPEGSVEAQDVFYNDFEVEPVREGKIIAGYNSKPRRT